MKLLGSWQLQLPERDETEARLLPYLLAGISDDQPEVAAVAVTSLQALGALYEQEHAQELQVGLLPACSPHRGWLARHTASLRWQLTDWRRFGPCMTVYVPVLCTLLAEA